MKKHFKHALDILLGVTAIVAAYGILVIAVKICWTVTEFIWGIW